MKSLKSTLLAATIAATGLLAGALPAQAAEDTIIFLSGPLTDPFFGAVKLGTDTAAKELGIDYQYSTTPDFNDIVALYARLTEAAIARKPAAIVIGNFFPDSVEPLIKQAVEEGIPVFVTNSGRTTWRDLGALGFVGEDPDLMGKAGGEAEAEAGVTNGICVNHVASNPVLERRCNGYIAAIEAAGGTAKMITIPYEDTTNDQKLQQAIGGALMSGKDVDGIFTLGPSVAMNAVAAVEQTGRDVVIGTTDLSTTALEAVRDGKLLFALDQQPFLQGYYGLMMASQYAKYKVAPVTEVNSGPFMIDASNVAAVLDVSTTYPGIRGAN
jgi:simple sugar transport system substrate-binding protein